jgi:hypothetical protein
LSTLALLPGWSWATAALAAAMPNMRSADNGLVLVIVLFTSTPQIPLLVNRLPVMPLGAGR